MDKRDKLKRMAYLAYCVFEDSVEGKELMKELKKMLKDDQLSGNLAKKAAAIWSDLQ